MVGGGGGRLEQGGPADGDVDMTPVKAKAPESKTGQEEPETTMQIRQGCSQRRGELRSQGCLLKEAHAGMKWTGPSTASTLCHWLDDGPKEHLG